LENSTIREVEEWDQRRKEELELRKAREEAERLENEKILAEKEETKRLEQEEEEKRIAELEVENERQVEAEPVSETESEKVKDTPPVSEEKVNHFSKNESCDQKSESSSPGEEKQPDNVVASNSTTKSAPSFSQHFVSANSNSNFTGLAPSTIPPGVQYAKSEIPLPKETINLNYSDFESDGTDPFENVELKSINDMEVLARVLQNHRITDSSSVPENCGQSVVNGTSNVTSGQVPIHGSYQYGQPTVYPCSQSYPPAWNAPGYYSQASANSGAVVTTVTTTTTSAGPSSGFPTSQTMPSQQPNTVSSSANSFTKFYFPLLTSMANSRRDKQRDWQTYGSDPPMYCTLNAGQSPVPTPVPVPSSHAMGLGATAPPVPSQPIPYLPNSHSEGFSVNTSTTAAHSPSHNYFVSSNHIPSQPNLSGLQHFNSYNNSRLPPPYSVPNKFPNSNEGTPR